MNMRSLLTLLLPVWLAVSPATAQNANPVGGPSLPLDVSLVRQVLEGFPTALHVFINMGSKEYALQLPDGFRMQNEPAQGRLLIPRTDNSCWMTFRIIKTPVGGINLSASACRSWLLDEYPGATITSETTVSAGGNSGPAFDLQWRSAGLKQSARVAYIPSAAGILEFKLVSSTSQFGNAANYLKNLMMSFRICPYGKRDLPPMSKFS